MEVESEDLTDNISALDHAYCEDIIADLPNMDNRICTISKQDRCPIVAVCINFEQLEMISNPEVSRERTPLLRVQWQCMEKIVEKILFITISQVLNDHCSTVNPELAKRFVNDNLAIQEFAKKMYSAYNIRLATIEYPPFVLTFQHYHVPNIPSILNNKGMLNTLLKEFLHRGETQKTKTKYQISVKTSQIDDDNGTCHCFDVSNGDLTKQPTLPAEVEARFQNIEEELSDQRQFMDFKYEQQEKQYEDIHANLAKIKEFLSEKNKGNTQLIKVPKHIKPWNSFPENAYEHKYGETDGIQIHEEKTVLQGKHKQRTDHEAEAWKWHKVEVRRVDEMALNDSLINTQESKEDKHEEEHNSDDWGDTDDNPVPNNVYNIISQSTSSVKTENDLVSCTGPSDQMVKGIRSEDDLYSDVHEETSPYHGYSYKSTGYSKYQNTASYQPGYSGKAKMLVIPADVYYNQQQTGQSYMSSSGSSSSVLSYSGMTADSTYNSFDPFPDVQTEGLNFDLQRTKQLFASEPERVSTEPKKEKVWESQSGRQKLKLMIDCMIDNCSSWKRLSVSAEEAMLEDERHVPRADEAMDTVICLDTSGSMAGDPFQQLKGITMEFIDGVEAIAAKYDIKENIALVTFGGKAKVIHHLSNDYGSLREAREKVEPGGPGPILEGLVVSMACLLKGGLLRLQSKLKLSPRFVLMSDGYPSREISENAPDDSFISGQDILQITNAFDVLSSKQLDDGLPSPVIVIPIGKYVNLSCLQTLATHTGGIITRAESFPQMSKFHRLQRIAFEGLKYVRNRQLSSRAVETTFTDFLSQYSDIEAGQVSNFYTLNMEKMLVYYGSPYNFYNIHEESELPLLGSRVMRGADWRWGNQDTEGPGTIFNHCRDKMVWVCWDNEHVNVYRYGHNGKYDVVTVDDQPRVMDGCAPDIGVQVQRGPDWPTLYQEQDCGQGHYGVVIRKNTLGNVMVRWQSGEIYDYRYGRFNKYDIVMRDPVTSILEITANMQMDVPNPTESGGKEAARNYEWQRRDAVNGWEPYSDENNAKLKRAYSKNPLGSCLIQINHKSFRVSFKALEERSIDDRTSVHDEMNTESNDDVIPSQQKMIGLMASHGRLTCKSLIC